MIYQDKIFGNIRITEPVILELIKTPQVQRLKKIHQSGIYYYFYHKVSQKRFDHSIGVYWLLKNFGAAVDEQVAGLLHDISHTVFSHVIDHLYGSFVDESHQDEVHGQYFKNNEIASVLKKYSLDADKISDLNRWKLLDKPLPEVCADRLHYALFDSLTIDRLDRQEALKYINDIVVIGNQFVFKSIKIARNFAELTYWMNKNFWHSDWGSYSFYLMKEILKQSLDSRLINENDLLTDDEAIDKKLNAISDPVLSGLILKLKNFKLEKVVQDNVNYDFIKTVSKTRVVDPFVQTGEGLKKITELFPEFKEKFNKEKSRVKSIRYLKYLG